MAEADKANPAHALFDNFIQAETCKEVLKSFSELCRHLEVDPHDYKHFYGKLKDRLNYWKAKALWVKLDKRAAHSDYMEGQACAKNKCLVLGAGPCGLRTAVELALLGAQVVVLEMREAFSRNNVLHLWPFTIHDLRELAAKKFYGKFACGVLDHISIRQLQLILLKVALLLGVEVHTGVQFKGLKEPSGTTGWRAQLSPEGHPAADFQFDVFVSAGGGRFVPEGFRRKELRGQLAIGITANFINRHTSAEAQVPEISGVARIYNQRFFQELHTEMGIDLENIVYYKDDTHYFVMTAKKKSLLKKGVIKQDFSDAEQLLAPSNVCQEALRRYAYEAADFSTGHCLPNLEFAHNHANRPDVAMFDFTCMHRAENASLVREKKNKRLLVALVGDCLVEPFWPLGTGIARGFMASLDTAWMVRSWGKGVPPLQVLAERESIYKLLSQTSPENTSKNYPNYSINPCTRYPNVNTKTISPNQVQHLYYREDLIDGGRLNKRTLKQPSRRHNESGSSTLVDLLRWSQRNTHNYKGVKVKDLKESWRSGLALCALIHRFRPELIDFSSLDGSNAVGNNQLAFDILQRELGIAPIMSGADMARSVQIDQLSMVLYLSQIHTAFSKRAPPTDEISLLAPSKPLSLFGARSAVSFLNKLKHNSLQRRKECLTAEREKKNQGMRKEEEEEEALIPEAPVAPVAPDSLEAPLSSQVCYFCDQGLYVLERDSAEGKFFHRSCFACHHCNATLRQGGYTYDQSTGRFYCELHSEEMELGHRNFSTHTKDGSAESEQDGSSGEEGSDRGMNGEREMNESVPSPASLDPAVAVESPGPHPVPEEARPPTYPTHPQAQQPEPPQKMPPKGSASASPVPAPRGARANKPLSPPMPKPRTIHLPAQPPSPSKPLHSLGIPERKHEDVVEENGEDKDELFNETPTVPAEDGSENGADSASPMSKASLRKLELSDEERSQLGSLSFSQDSDSETPASSSASSSSSKRVDGAEGAVEEEGSWNTGQTRSQSREHRHRRCFRRKGEHPTAANPNQQGGRVRSKFSPWNLSSPRLGRDHRLSVHVEGADGVNSNIYQSGEENGEDDEDDFMFPDNVDFLEQQVPSDPVEAQKLELRKMRTLERQAKMSEIQRFHRAQTIQRRLEEIEVTFKDLEEKGVDLERTLREESDSGDSDLIDDWIELVEQKNALVSEESDLMVASRTLELEDKQSMLEMELRRWMEINDSEKSAEEQEAEKRVLAEMLEVVDMRNSLVTFLEEKRLKELSEPQLTSSLMETKRHSAAGAQVHWE
ncbi:F-actin-monooxygenase mical1 isoform X2 [Clupea harengus]|uniref:Molecule interacting with CasL protein 1 n=1 Tax=Clupea harengus TaxID=7950 RepID=A0A6P8FF56_CLUHA|nr:F-actin-monooxygenase mical1 isoform X2 [Clupea harengus]